MTKGHLHIAFLLIVAALNYACKTNKTIDPEIAISRPEQKIDLDKAAVQLMDTITHGLLGRWNVSQVQYDIKHLPAIGSVKNDTTFQNFALLNIHAVTREENPKYPVIKGQLNFEGRTYPVQFRLISDPNRLIYRNGPQAFTLLEYAFPNGTKTWKEEEMFFRDSGLIGENYSIEFDPQSKKMVWKGLNKDIKRIILKQM